MPSRVEWGGLLKKTLLVFFGTALIAFGSAVFIIPFGLVSGGVSGAAVILERLIGGALSVEVIMAYLSFGTFVLGFIFLGTDFAMKTLLSSLLYPALTSIFLRIASPEVLSGYFYLAGAENSELALVTSAVLGGVFFGAGCASAFRGGGSTGGMDIIALVWVKYSPRLKSSRAILVIDGAIVLVGAFVFQSLIFTTLGVISALTASLTLDRIFLSEREALTLEIISGEWRDIKREIIERFHRTATILVGLGGYTGEERVIMRVTVSMREYHELVGLIYGIDRAAFVTAHRAHEISGEGWGRK